jgi:hypothetical protein
MSLAELWSVKAGGDHSIYLEPKHDICICQSTT